MKLKCAHCEQKSISLWAVLETYTSRCPSCNAEVLIVTDSKIPLIVFITSLTALFILGLLFKPGFAVVYLSALFLVLFYSLILLLTVKTQRIPAHFKPPAVSPKGMSTTLTGLFLYCALIPFVKNTYLLILINAIGGYSLYRLFKFSSQVQK